MSEIVTVIFPEQPMYQGPSVVWRNGQHSNDMIKRPARAGDPIDWHANSISKAFIPDTGGHPYECVCGGSGRIVGTHHTDPEPEHDCQRDTDGDGGCWARDCAEHHRGGYVCQIEVTP